MKLLVAIVLGAMLVAPALAQQPDAGALQKAIAVIQAQRNQAMDAAANCEVNASRATEALTKAEARIKELEDKYEPKAKP
jgi:hypothetical protein